ncbi:hypothetical protein NDU88_005387 [Pleurodeles waltl]|uniref:Uncharacterized protein n=1 Tax=Pleurodeles waltl TaxID=8319 RepID=A0AAV7RM35_PLEWA|nr:hypothetical protein NDU88_005387 [Pleurodeles waltl]
MVPLSLRPGSQTGYLLKRMVRLAHLPVPCPLCLQGSGPSDSGSWSHFLFSKPMVRAHSSADLGELSGCGRWEGPPRGTLRMLRLASGMTVGAAAGRWHDVAAGGESTLRSPGRHRG